jgi:hypothetical protein
MDDRVPADRDDDDPAADPPKDPQQPVTVSVEVTSNGAPVEIARESIKQKMASAPWLASAYVALIVLFAVGFVRSSQLSRDNCKATNENRALVKAVIVEATTPPTGGGDAPLDHPGYVSARQQLLAVVPDPRKC